MAVQFERTNDGALILCERAPLAAKLFGLPFAAAGAYFAWHVVGGAVDMLRGGDVLTMIPGTLLLLVFAALFGGFGLVLLIGRREMRVDSVTAEIASARHFGFYTRHESWPFSRYESVLVTWGTPWSSEVHSRNEHVVTLLPRERNLHVGTFDSKEAALRCASELAALMRVPLRDASGPDAADEFNESA